MLDNWQGLVSKLRNTGAVAHREGGGLGGMEMAQLNFVVKFVENDTQIGVFLAYHRVCFYANNFSIKIVTLQGSQH